MVFGPALTDAQVERAIHYNERRFDGAFLETVRSRLGLPGAGAIDEELVRHVATWQETSVGSGLGDGMIGPQTEAHLNILLPEASRAADAAERIRVQGNVLFDSWGNDLRDNDLDGLVDEADESTPDGSHFGRTYGGFNVRRGAWVGGWNYPQYGYPRRTLSVSVERDLRGTFRYAVCADVASEAYREAGVMEHHGSTREILDEFRRLGYVWRRSEGYPTEYLPGDFMCTWAVGGGHSAVIVEAGPTAGGARAPTVVELPGPSSQISDRTYDPASTCDIVRHEWSGFRLLAVDMEHQYLGRLLHTALHRRRRP
jgi:hypothetical protein